MIITNILIELRNDCRTKCRGINTSADNCLGASKVAYTKRLKTGAYGTKYCIYGRHVEIEKYFLAIVL